MATTTVPTVPVQPDRRGESPASALLRAGVPLTLLLDLLDPRGPRSEELYRAECCPVEVCPGEVGPGEVCPGEVCRAEAT